MCTIADAKVRQNYNCYNVYFNECLPYSFEIYIFDAFYFRDLKICLELSSPCLHLPLYLIFTCMSAYHCKQLVNKLPQLR